MKNIYIEIETEKEILGDYPYGCEVVRIEKESYQDIFTIEEIKKCDYISELFELDCEEQITEIKVEIDGKIIDSTIFDIEDLLYELN